MQRHMIVLMVLVCLSVTGAAGAKDEIRVTSSDYSLFPMIRPVLDTRVYLDVPFFIPEGGSLRSTFGLTNDFGDEQHFFQASLGPRIPIFSWAHLTIQGGVIAGWFGPRDAGLITSADFEFNFPENWTEINVRIHGHFNQIRGDLYSEVETLGRPHPIVRAGFLIQQIVEDVEYEIRLGPTLGINVQQILEIKLTWLLYPNQQTHGVNFALVFRLPRGTDS